MTFAPFGAVELARPWGLAVLAAAVPIVLLHLYRRRRIVVPFLPLLLEGLGPARPFGGWKRLQDGAALAARLLALLALGVALAGLRPAEAGPPPEDLVVVLDADVTTSVREADGRPRLAHAIDLARARVLSGRWAAVTVVLAANPPRILVASTADRDVAAEALVRAGRDLVPDRGTADLALAVRLARGRAKEAMRARVVVVSSRVLEEAPGGGEAPLEALGPGEARDDQGLVDLDVRQGDVGARLVLRLRLRNDAAEARTRRLVVALASPAGGERLLLDREVALEPAALAEELVEIVAPREGAWMRASLAGDDVFPANDRLSAWVAAPHRPSVLAVHDGAPRPYVRAILAAMGERLDADASGFVRVADLSKAGPRDVVLVDGVPLPPGSLRPGAWLFLAPLGGDSPFAVGEPTHEPLVWRTAEGHPLVRDVDLATAYVSRAFPIETTAAQGGRLRGLAFAEGKAVVAEGEKDGVRWIAIGLDPDASDLPVRAALPLLVRNAVLALAQAPVEPLEPYYRLGAPLRPRVALPGGPLVRVRSDGFGADEVRVAPEGETWTVPAAAAGEAEITTSGEGGATWTARTAFLDLAPGRTVVPARPRSALPAPVALAEEVEARWRRMLLLAALGLLVVDLALSRGLRTGVGRPLAAAGRPRAGVASAPVPEAAPPIV